MLITFTNAGPNNATFTVETQLFSVEILMRAMIEQAHVADDSFWFTYNEYTGRGEAYVRPDVPVGRFRVSPVIPPMKGGGSIAR